MRCLSPFTAMLMMCLGNNRTILWGRNWVTVIEIYWISTMWFLVGTCIFYFKIIYLRWKECRIKKWGYVWYMLNMIHIILPGEKCFCVPKKGYTEKLMFLVNETLKCLSTNPTWDYFNSITFWRPDFFRCPSVITFQCSSSRRWFLGRTRTF